MLFNRTPKDLRIVENQVTRERRCSISFYGLLASVLVFISLSAFAQENEAKVAKEIKVAEEAEPWRKVCEDENDSATCRMVQELFLRQEVDGEQKTLGRVLGASVIYASETEGGERAPYLSMKLPLGVDLRSGAALRVDKNEEISLQFLRCTNQGCDVSLKLSGDFVNSLKAGNTLYVGFRPWGEQDTSVLNVSLIGFTKIFGELK